MKNLAKKIGKGIATGALGIAMATGCYKGPNIQENPSKFFACNYWIDENQDGMTSDSEYKGIKTTFRAREPILFVAEVYDRAGDKVNFKIVNADGKVVVEKPSTVSFRGYCVVKRSFEPWELYKKGARGSCTAFWELNGVLVNRTAISLIE